MPVLSEPEAWELQARCRQEDPRLFFGPPGFEPKRDRIERETAAKAICARCPSLRPCRDQALQSGELYGVWGGLGEADRRALLRGTEHRLPAARAV